MHWAQLTLTVIIIPYLAYKNSKWEAIQKDIGDIKIAVVGNTKDQGNDHDRISELHSRIQDCEQRESNHENRIIKIEAVLFEDQRKKIAGF